jgi:hypothetical protein
MCLWRSMNNDEPVNCRWYDRQPDRTTHDCCDTLRVADRGLANQEPCVRRQHWTNVCIHTSQNCCGRTHQGCATWSPYQLKVQRPLIRLALPYHACYYMWSQQCRCQRKVRVRAFAQPPPGVNQTRTRHDGTRDTGMAFLRLCGLGTVHYSRCPCIAAY